MSSRSNPAEYKLLHLIKQWRSFINEVERRYDNYIEEYENDLSVRDLIAAEVSALESLSDSTRTILEELDRRFVEATMQRFGSVVNSSEQWKGRVPKVLGNDMVEDLASETIALLKDMPEPTSFTEVAETGQPHVWIFQSSGRHASAVFSTKAKGDEWIARTRASGTLTQYILDTSAYDWAIETGRFVPKGNRHRTPGFIERFTIASQDHYHYEQGWEGGMPENNASPEGSE